MSKTRYVIAQPMEEDMRWRFYAETLDPPWTFERDKATTYFNHEAEPIVGRLWKGGNNEATICPLTENETLDKLQGLLERRTVIVGRWFKGTSIKLDGYRFVGCRFEDCRLWYQTPDFVLDDCAFVGKVNVRQGDGPAQA